MVVYEEIVCVVGAIALYTVILAIVFMEIYKKSDFDREYWENKKFDKILRNFGEMREDMIIEIRREMLLYENRDLKQKVRQLEEQLEKCNK